MMTAEQMKQHFETSKDWTLIQHKQKGKSDFFLVSLRAWVDLHYFLIITQGASATGWIVEAMTDEQEARATFNRL